MQEMQLVLFCIKNTIVDSWYISGTQNTSSSEPTELLYKIKIKAVQTAADLEVLQITSNWIPIITQNNQIDVASTKNTLSSTNNLIQDLRNWYKRYKGLIWIIVSVSKPMRTLQMKYIIYLFIQLFNVFTIDDK